MNNVHGAFAALLLSVALSAAGCGDSSATIDSGADSGAMLDASDGSTDTGAGACDGEPCENGTCRAEADASFSCECDPGFEGEICDMEIDCGELETPTPPLEVTVTGGTAFGAVATYACQDGYDLSGDATRTCGESGWSGTEPSCRIECNTDSCNGNGICSVEDGGTVCACDDRWSGDRCDTRIDCGALAVSGAQLSVTYTANDDAEDTGVDAVATYACDAGYELNGSPTMRTCNADSTWTPPGEPACRPVDCGAPSSSGRLDVALDAGTTTLGSTATYSCSAGFRLEGDATATCGADGSWSGTRTCPRIRCATYMPTDTVLSVDNPTARNFGAEVSFSCPSGLALSGGTVVRCEADSSDQGIWNGTEPSCEVPPRVCEPTTCNGNGNCVEVGGVFDRCECNAGWNGATCDIATDCGVILPAGASLSVGYAPNGAGDSTGYQAVATYSCATGTTLAGTPTSRTCAADGSWTPSGEPSCVAVDCGSPAMAPANGDLSFTTTTYLSTASYSCDTGFTLDGAAMVTCLDTAAWSAGAPDCDIVQCGTPPASNGSGSSLDSSSGTAFGDTASYVCSAGYTGAGGDLSCNALGSWTGSALSCTPVDCGDPAAPTDGDVTFGATTFGQMATYSCDPGFATSDPTSATCQADGSWSVGPPTCGPATCTLRYDLHDSRFYIRDTTAGLGNSTITGDGTATGPLSGHLIVRTPSSGGAPSGGVAEILEYELVQDFEVSNVVTDVTASAGDGSAAVATGTLTTGTTHTLTFSPCTLPTGTDVDEPNYMTASSYTPDDLGTGAGCLAPYRSQGTVTCNALAFICSIGNLSVGANAQNETWEQPLNEITLAGDYSTLTMSTTGNYTRDFSGVGAAAIPNRSPSTTWVHWAGGLVSMVCD